MYFSPVAGDAALRLYRRKPVAFLMYDRPVMPAGHYIAAALFLCCPIVIALLYNPGVI